MPCGNIGPSYLRLYEKSSVVSSFPVPLPPRMPEAETVCLPEAETAHAGGRNRIMQNALPFQKAARRPLALCRGLFGALQNKHSPLTRLWGISVFCKNHLRNGSSLALPYQTSKTVGSRVTTQQKTSAERDARQAPKTIFSYFYLFYYQKGRISRPCPTHTFRTLMKHQG